MSLADFQRALAALSASPQMVRDLRAGRRSVLDGFDLSPRERARLQHAANAPGMAAQCSLYRIMRLAALNAVLPRTLAALGSAVGPLVEAYWTSCPLHDLRFLPEAERFVAFLKRHPELLAHAAGTAADAVSDLLRIEFAIARAHRATLRGAASTVTRYRYRPSALLEAAAAGLGVLAALPRGRFQLRIETAPAGITLWEGPIDTAGQPSTMVISTRRAWS
ncbi:MAG: hypothetical protein NZM40_06040 [Sphingomonadaceae bacterium]|uniref:hypothetical protein n=1 Tax=Thermaurantiacus sp. TaxID=2820283 RepID=UPI00298EEC81|nr:hypothetical protein [Thermaurantiacus sp.]MCS6986979.1 hypothetical protein [Sphingomonadaceae bacterium]MDW8415420.1 hypothetical protein [Thermaurantiacus sp.]